MSETEIIKEASIFGVFRECNTGVERHFVQQKGIYITNSGNGEKTINVVDGESQIIFILKENECQHLVELLSR